MLKLHCQSSRRRSHSMAVIGTLCLSGFWFAKKSMDVGRCFIGILLSAFLPADSWPMCTANSVVTIRRFFSVVLFRVDTQVHLGHQHWLIQAEETKLVYNSRFDYRKREVKRFSYTFTTHVPSWLRNLNSMWRRNPHLRGERTKKKNKFQFNSVTSNNGTVYFSFQSKWKWCTRNMTECVNSFSLNYWAGAVVRVRASAPAIEHYPIQV